MLAVCAAVENSEYNYYFKIEKNYLAPVSAI